MLREGGNHAHDSPSRRHGIPQDSEERLHFRACMLIQALGKQLQLTSFSILTGCMYYHFFYTKESLRTNNYEVVAVTALFLAIKVEDSSKHIHEVLKAFQRLRSEPNVTPIDDKGPYYELIRDTLTAVEWKMLTMLDFDFETPNFLKLVMKYCKKLEYNEVAQEISWQLLLDSFRFPISLYYTDKTIACSIVLITSSVLQLRLRAKDFIEKLCEADIGQVTSCVRDLKSYYTIASGYPELNSSSIFEQDSRIYLGQSQQRFFDFFTHEQQLRTSQKSTNHPTAKVNAPLLKPHIESLPSKDTKQALPVSSSKSDDKIVGSKMKDDTKKTSQNDKMNEKKVEKHSEKTDSRKIDQKSSRLSERKEERRDERREETRRDDRADERKYERRDGRWTDRTNERMGDKRIDRGDSWKDKRKDDLTRDGHRKDVGWREEMKREEWRDDERRDSARREELKRDQPRGDLRRDDLRRDGRYTSDKTYIVNHAMNLITTTLGTIEIIHPAKNIRVEERIIKRKEWSADTNHEFQNVRANNTVQEENFRKRMGERRDTCQTALIRIPKSSGMIEGGRTNILTSDMTSVQKRESGRQNGSNTSESINSTFGEESSPDPLTATTHHPELRRSQYQNPVDHRKTHRSQNSLIHPNHLTTLHSQHIIFHSNLRRTLLQLLGKENLKFRRKPTSPFHSVRDVPQSI
ncbi:hypothetical protein BLNAU_17416 [Blattamonas nauphoetae]|uniref:Cyclin-like domain-containing protein n=1 Tax=Blattamonas nauphoetae TaxID=2049346 RepID=A0ABQ9X9X7_9EUKA|nr:hypothetical protein BLNAU_17416 [Blattamonas nauphoetae]